MALACPDDSYLVDRLRQHFQACEQLFWCHILRPFAARSRFRIHAASSGLIQSSSSCILRLSF